MPYEQNYNQPIDNDCNYILDLLRKIDRIQKDVMRIDENICVGCEMALLSSCANTIPISIYTDCCEAFTAIIDLEGTTTNVFRIESIKCDRYVTLRLLEITTDEPPVIVSTNRTIILDITRIRALQCFEPITVEPCTTTNA